MKSTLVEQLSIYKYRYQISYALLLVVPLLLLLVKLGDLTPGLNALEARSALQSQDLGGILSNPVNFPYQLLQYLSITLLGPTAWAVRLPSVIFGILLLVGMFKLFHIWHQPRIAIIGTLFVAASSWFLNFARFGTPAIVVATMIVAVLLVSAWFHHADNKSIKSLLLLGAVVALSLYTPLVIYFLGVAVLAHYKLIWRHIKALSNYQLAAAGLISLLVLAPVAWAIFNDTGVAREILGLPGYIPSLADVMLNALSAFGAVFWRSEEFPALHLGTLALLDIFTASMTALGLYHYERHYDHHRTRLLMIGFFAVLLGTGLSGSPMLLIALLPFVYIFAATGVITMLTQWYAIFPKNPIARTVAILPLGAVLLVTAYYHSHRYFVAWARAPETKEVFSENAQSLKDSVATFPEAERAILVVTKDKDRVEFALSNLPSNVYVTIKEPSEFSEVEGVDGIDVVFVESGSLTISELALSLGVAPQRVTTSSQKRPVSYYRFDLVTP